MVRMASQEQVPNANCMLMSGRSDEEIERLTGVGLGELLGLRAMLAAAPLRVGALRVAALKRPR